MTATGISDMVDCCPECGGTALSQRSGTESMSRPHRKEDNPDARYWCRDCETGFDKLDQRERQSPGGAGSLGAKLLAADADEVLENARAGVDGGDA